MSVSTALTANGFPTLAELCESPDDFLRKLDVGALNLICAHGLPGAENLDVAAGVAWLDAAAQQVDWQVRERFDMFARTPATFDNSFGAFCCNYLVRTLQELYGVQYNPARIESSSGNPLTIMPDFSDSRDMFIHGMMGGPGGTCASMPVLYVAVGRRLGWPLKLVETRGHLFFRWDDPEGKLFNVPERFNVEGTGPGMTFYSDDFYRTWPHEWLPYDKVGGWYLKSLTPAEELAGFLSSRASCLADNNRLQEALEVVRWARKLVPDDLRYGMQQVKLMSKSYDLALKSLENERHMLEVDRMMFEQKQHHMNAAMPMHPGGCQCAQCRQARQPTRQAPGHPPGCPCAMCNQTHPW